MRAENDRNKQHCHKRQRARRGFEHAPDHESPTAAGKVLQHQQR
jgi:hypothetical protein